VRGGTDRVRESEIERERDRNVVLYRNCRVLATVAEKYRIRILVYIITISYIHEKEENMR